MKKVFYLAPLLSFFILCSTSCPNVPFESDYSLPECSITSPVDGSEFVIGDTVEILVEVTSFLFIRAVEIYFRSEVVEIYFRSEVGYSDESPYCYDWDTEGYDPGEYNIEGCAFDEDLGEGCCNVNVILKEKIAATD